MAIAAACVTDGFTGSFSGSFLETAGSAFTGPETGRTFGEHAAVISAMQVKSSHLFPFNSGRWFRTDVIYYPVNAFYVVNDLV